MKVIGLDPGSHKTGFAILENDELIDHGIINLGSGSLAERLLTLKLDLEDLLSNHGVFDVAGVETPFVGPNKGAIASLAQARGVIICILATQATSIVDITPQHAKMATGGGGHAKKETVCRLMAQRFKAKFISEDAADAVAIALAAARRESSLRLPQSSRSRLPKSRRQGP